MIDAGTPAKLDSAKAAGVATPETAADTLYDPATVLAVAVIVAKPAAFVTAVAEDRTAREPDAGVEKLTVAPLTGLLPESRTVTWRGDPKAEFTDALCGEPAATLMEAGAPGELVKLNEAGEATPPTLAATV